jgi:hypothetical protein
MTRRMLLTLSALALTACAGPLHGPEADLASFATPDAASPTVRAMPQLPPGPRPEHGQFRAWVPPATSANGDSASGYWLMISTTPPAMETLEPVKPMPRAPKTHAPAKPAVASPQPPAPQVAQPQPVLPMGLSLGDVQGMSQNYRAPLSRSLLGGQ